MVKRLAMSVQKPWVYDGYIAQPEIDEEDGIISGSVMGIRDAITFQGKTVEEAKKAFHEAVDAYKALCKKEGKEPERPFSGNILFRTTPEVHKAISRAAQLKGQRVNAWMNTILAEAAQNALQPSQEIRDLPLKVPETMEKTWLAETNTETLLEVILSSLEAAAEMVSVVRSLPVNIGEFSIKESVLQSLGTYRDNLVTVTGGEQSPEQDTVPKRIEDVKMAETARRRLTRAT